MSLVDLAAEKSEQTADIPPPSGPRRGRPPGSGKKPVAAAPVQPDPNEIPPEVVAQLLDASLAQVVQIPCVQMGWKPLDEKESAAMVGGCKPLLNKYLPDLLGAWAPEILFLAMCLSIYGTRFAAQRAEQNRERQQHGRAARTGSGSHGHREDIPGEATRVESPAFAGGGSPM